jgi:low affinity Fe/Cu permease
MNIAPHLHRSGKHLSAFERFAATAMGAAGSSRAFALAFGTVATWLALGPVFGFSEKWQLFINTGTTIVTFLT